MGELTLDRADQWTRRTGLVAVAALAWTVFVPPGAFWSGVLAGALLGSALTTAALVQRRRTPSLTRLIANAGPARQRPRRVAARDSR